MLPNGWVKSILDMLYRQRAVFACQGNDVEPDGQVDAELAQIGIGRRDDSSNLCIVDAFLRAATHSRRF